MITYIPPLADIKSEAKFYKKHTTGISHVATLDKVANRYGFKEYKILKSYVEKNPNIHKQTLGYHKEHHGCDIYYEEINNDALKELFTFKEAALIYTASFMLHENIQNWGMTELFFLENNVDQSLLKKTALELDKIIQQRNIINTLKTDKKLRVALSEDNEIEIFYLSSPKIHPDKLKDAIKKTGDRLGVKITEEENGMINFFFNVPTKDKTIDYFPESDEEKNRVSYIVNTENSLSKISEVNNEFLKGNSYYIHISSKSYIGFSPELNNSLMRDLRTEPPYHSERIEVSNEKEKLKTISRIDALKLILDDTDLENDMGLKLIQGEQ